LRAERSNPDKKIKKKNFAVLRLYDNEILTKNHFKIWAKPIFKSLKFLNFEIFEF
jgi:hypothetical protein